MRREFVLTTSCFLGFCLGAIKNQGCSLGLCVVQHTYSKAQGVGPGQGGGAEPTPKWGSAVAGAAGTDESCGQGPRPPSHPSSTHLQEPRVRAFSLAHHPHIQPEPTAPMWRDRKQGWGTADPNLPVKKIYIYTSKTHINYCRYLVSSHWHTYIFMTLLPGRPARQTCNTPAISFSSRMIQPQILPDY